MTKSELIEAIARKQKHLPAKDVELAVKHLLDIMSDSLAKGQRIEIRGFGSFSLHYRPPRIGRNPKTGEAVALSGKPALLAKAVIVEDVVKVTSTLEPLLADKALTEAAEA